MQNINVPDVFQILLSDKCIEVKDIIKTDDGFYIIYKSLSDILLEKGITDFPDTDGCRLQCDKYFDDWFLYAIASDDDYTYSLLKMREQEHDAEYGSPADGDDPGVTISFIAFEYDIFLNCLASPTDENREKMSDEINRVVAYRGQKHHRTLKKYFKNPRSDAPYLVAVLYTRLIAAFAEGGYIETPEFYKETVQRSISYKKITKHARLPLFIQSLNRDAGYTVCDNERIYIKNPDSPTEYESAAILATHTGNTSLFSFAAEVEYHAKFLTPLAKIKLPFYGRSIYDSAIRADMTVCESELQGPAPFYQSGSKIVKRQFALHHKSL